MQTQNDALFNRNDTLFGVCEGVGQTFGFNANYLRIALGVGLLWSPVAMVAIYLALGVAVYASRLLVRAPKQQAADVQPEAQPQSDVAVAAEQADEYGEERELAEAA